ncbi:Hsp70 family protein [Phaeobacter sp. PT47_59]|uniref:Hsp70 family protein n=1 Tax=Phaeobacter sp. PT47_59 TaxID=3029979 RepID=UPI00238098AB|nr:Hsp70 family protein [Phaeobacter sp. PT47_59]MDE4172692.1 Hsp70 family protein [Phaeobacter sp. PT47_59]
MTAPATLGIDFGTSNSAAGVAVAGQPYLIELEPGEQSLPTAVFFDGQTGRMRIGNSAIRALTAGEEGRFMRALKSLLGTPLLHEERRLGGERLTFADVIARFLAELKRRAETQTRMTFTHALSGRPVRFHSKDEDRNLRAEEDLRACYLKAGFEDVCFMLEPEAALRATSPREGLGLIVDIGGGTSDFTAFRQEADGATQILASHGIRLGGTDFDQCISLAKVMPLLGRGSQIRDSFGPGTLPAPNRIFNDLSSWQMIPFLYTPEELRAARDLMRHAVEPERFARLVSTLEDQLGHDLAFAVEAAKIAVNQPHADAASVNLGLLEQGLQAPLASRDLNTLLEAQMQELLQAARDTLRQADVAPKDIGRIVLVGGSALLSCLQDRMVELCPAAKTESDHALSAVADGLALAAADAFA